MPPVPLLDRRFEVRAPLAQAWDHLERVQAWPSWARHIRRIELQPPGPLRVGSEGTIHLTNGIRSRFRVTEIEPGAHWRWVGRFLWLAVDYDHGFRALPSGATELTFAVAASGWGAGTIGRLFALLYAANLDRAIPRLVQELSRS